VAFFGIFPVIFSVLHPDWKEISIACLIVSALGAAFSTLWLFVTRQANAWVQLWTDKLEQIETSPGFPNVKVFRGEEAKALHTNTFAFHKILIFVPILFIGLWLVIFSVAAMATSYFMLSSRFPPAPASASPSSPATPNQNKSVRPIAPAPSK
jgi:hypothetical protein